MSEPQPSTDERPPTPESRSHYAKTGNPVDAMPSFEVGKTAWISVSREVPCEGTVVARKKEGTQFVYQLRRSNGSLYKAGAWVPQEMLSESG